MVVRTVARKFSVGGFCISAGGICVCVEGLDIPKIDKNSTDLYCFIFQFGRLGDLFVGAKPTKAPRGDGTDGGARYNLNRPPSA